MSDTSLQRRPRRVRRLLIAAAAAVGIAVTLSLGRWQLGRAAEKIAIQDAIAAQEALPPLDAAALQPVRMAADAATAARLVHRRIVLTGRWQADRTVYLDNRQMDGRPGFFVLTPLVIAPGTAVLVQRGWIPRDFLDRTRLSVIATPDGPVTVQGRIAAPPSQLYDFGTSRGPAEGSSAIRQNLDLPAFRRETGLPLAALTVLQTGEASEGLQRRWPAIASGVEKHYGYAVQWFGLAALIAILYVWFQFIRRPAAARRDDRP